jgi:hypothetical protein
MNNILNSALNTKYWAAKQTFRGQTTMLKKVFVLLISLLFLFSGCANNSPDAAEINPEGSEQTPSSGLFFPHHADGYKNNDELLLNIGAAKFSEFDKSSYNPKTIEALQGLTALYEPGYIKQDFTMTGITVAYVHRLTLRYRQVIAGEFADFDWARHVPAENATIAFLGRGASAEYIEERNGITYGVTEWANETGELDGYMVGWAQHGQTFTANLTASFTLEEVFTFCDAQPIEAWELLGDAISVSIQGMENVSVYDDEDNAIVIEDDIVYKINGGVPGGANMGRIGYRWLIDESASRYQYVLEPNEYIFHAGNAISEPELLVKHFADGECVSEASYTKTPAGDSFTQFSLSVTPNPADNTFNPD